MAVLSVRAIVSLRYTPVSGGSASRAVGGFLRYIQYRDHHEEAERSRGVDGFLRYAAFRDRTTPRGRLFDRHGDAGSEQRLALGRYVAKSTAELVAKPQQRPERAVYRLVISPENSRGIDLRTLTYALMDQLEADAGPLPPWIAAEHRNTAHPHVHVVLAARRQVGGDQYRELRISKPRLERMKQGVHLEMSRQRGLRVQLERMDPLSRLAEHVVQARLRPKRHRLRTAWLLRAAARRLAHHCEQEAERDREQERQRQLEMARQRRSLGRGRGE